MIHSFSSLLFPAECLHCSEPLFETNLLCQVCLDQLECIDPHDRCRRCFALDCCCKNLKAIGRLGACFEYEGAQKSLLVAFKYSDKPYLAKSLAGFLLLQHVRLGWEMPDYITYVPQSFLRACQRGYNQSKLLASELGALMQTPVVRLVKRSRFTPSQTMLSQLERKQLSPDSFLPYSRHNVADKRILLIDDVYTTGTTISCAADALAAHNPKSIDVLCLMK